VDRIDELVRLTGELTVVKNAIGHASALAQDGADAQAIAAALRDQHGLLNRLVGELQRSVLGIRVLPMRHVFQRFPRLVREISASVHKPVRLVVEGEETEADKAIVEAVFEPLLHAVRNAVDHGIEPGDRRAALGKPETGTLRLRAARAGDYVQIEVEDDGGGIDVARIRLVAAERRVASPEALAAMTDDAVIDLIFAPGFSTATEITGISGRGVGMDAVRAAVQRLGGRVTVQSEPGRGTVVRFTLPFEVMVTRVMTVEAGGQAFGIPLDSVTETVRVARDRIMPVGAARAFVLRHRTVPVVNLAEALGRPGSKSGPAEATIVVVRVGGQLGGIEVDRLGERMDIMLKPVEGLLGGLRGLSGTTLLGDGRVLIVLDLQEILL
jgi:two-component system chemotaxis sensor kinase CheA